MQEETQEGQMPEQGFDLDSYRNLLERLEASKRDQQRLDKKLPDSSQQQTV
jgi:hypothetical protein